MERLSTLAVAALGIALVLPAAAETAFKRTPSPKGAEVYFESPRNGATTGRDVVVRAGLHVMGVAPAGEDVPNTGHHHLLIDTDIRNMNEPIPVGNQIVHFSNGETEIKINLAPGWHTLQLDFADANHRQFDPPVLSGKIRIHARNRP